jgi:hypothetical protein
MWFLMAVGTLAVQSCSDNGTNGPYDPVLMPPSNLMACADSGVVLLVWQTSASESWSNFGSYLFRVRAKANDSTYDATLPKGTTSLRVKGLKNGTRYEFVLFAISTQGKRSDDSARVEWAPSLRHSLDKDGLPIRVYASTSTLPSGLDMNNDGGQAEALSVSAAAFKTRGDLFIYAANAVSDLQIVSPHLSQVNPGFVTEFSNVQPVDADSLDAYYATSSPSTGTYTQAQLYVPTSYVSKGRIYFGRIVRGGDKYYFRLFLKRDASGSLIHGTGFDRYIECEISYQDVRYVPFSKG